MSSVLNLERTETTENYSFPRLGLPSSRPAGLLLKMIAGSFIGTALLMKQNLRVMQRWDRLLL